MPDPSRNRLSQFVPFDLFGPNKRKQRFLRFDVAACDLIETHHHRPVPALLQEMGVGVIVTLLWAGLRHAEPALQRGQVMDMLNKYLEEDDGDLKVLSDVLIEALKASKVLGFKEDADEDDDSPNEQSAKDQQEPPKTDENAPVGS